MFNTYMSDSVILKRRTGTTSWGEKTTTRKTVSARVEDKHILIKDATGQDIMLQAVVYIKSTTLAVGDTITIDAVDHPVMTIRKVKAFSRVLCLEVGVG